MDMVVLIGLLALVSGLLAVIAGTVWWPLPSPAAERDNRIRDPRLVGWPHEAPARPFTEAEARNTLRRHAPCHVEHCARKAAAARVLRAAGFVASD